MNYIDEQKEMLKAFHSYRGQIDALEDAKRSVDIAVTCWIRGNHNSNATQPLHLFKVINTLTEEITTAQIHCKTLEDQMGMKA